VAENGTSPQIRKPQASLLLHNPVDLSSHVCPAVPTTKLIARQPPPPSYYLTFHHCSAIRSSPSNMSSEPLPFGSVGTPPPHTPSERPSDVDSDLDDRSSVASYDPYDDEAELAWRESLQELELLVSLVLVPFIGKWIGRKCAYWSEHSTFITRILPQLTSL
jgi:hypothetical protein